jgi:hypothetical protein
MPNLKTTKPLMRESLGISVHRSVQISNLFEKRLSQKPWRMSNVIQSIDEDLHLSKEELIALSYAAGRYAVIHVEPTKYLMI